MKKKFKMIIAGGKTGGHLFPGISIAQAILRTNPDAEILFVGIGEPFEIRTLARYGFAHQRISSTGIKGKGILEKLKAIIQVPISIMQAVNIIRCFKPDIVLGVGGFSSGAVVVGARLCRVKTAIHEQNSIAGITNRILQHFANFIFTSFKDTKGLNKSSKLLYTGNPIRKNEMDRTSNISSYSVISNLKKQFTILVTGGSQGSRSINTAFIEALKLMKYRDKYRIIHQTGASDEERVLLEYKKLSEEGIKKLKSDDILSDNMLDKAHNFDNISVAAFFNELPEIQASADLIICRAGAGTISEITALGKVAILVPYPYAADDHQTFNAKILSDKGAAWLIPDSHLSGEILKEKIEFASSHPDELAQMAQRTKELGNPFADEMIASICIKMADINTRAEM
ncbi:MAG: UDP-N-acetylglucosamine--N-acetylmuramyl-(pentapeptide) pyrophosphoryl-undecaprenol N-acetylglucosamine transferase [Desulfamplus sp.]|nr:UDP-N-acetylglucosamine--N-acetylmuramyl-(pentapeptide) pyrophosphoryl-undecaprenol N-acetylglucosamine transferase [Desulfamplus sp.]MBF0413549.1 UDP-N-acetylglucosamine--N-acetylmuramyl-(pentapeptide) pyrophosphoryl-undecaprenol N-acetylglucosamine transferase [Desulfamplus sp.]